MKKLGTNFSEVVFGNFGAWRRLVFENAKKEGTKWAILGSLEVVEGYNMAVEIIE